LIDGFSATCRRPVDLNWSMIASVEIGRLSHSCKQESLACINTCSLRTTRSKLNHLRAQRTKSLAATPTQNVRRPANQHATDQRYRAAAAYLLLTLLPPEFATQMLAPPNATPCRKAPTVKLPRRQEGKHNRCAAWRKIEI